MLEQQSTQPLALRHKLCIGANTPIAIDMRVKQLTIVNQVVTALYASVLVQDLETQTHFRIPVSFIGDADTSVHIAICNHNSTCGLINPYMVQVKAVIVFEELELGT